MEYIIELLLTCLISFIIYYNFKRRRKQSKIKTNQEFEWNPKPLIDETKHENFLTAYTESIIVNSEVGKWVEVDGKRLLNFASHNYLGLVENEYIRTKAKQAIRKYGVGSCGPRAFYGTVDVHLELEEKLATFFKTECAIVYSYGFSTITSAISAYIKKHDIVFADEKINFAIQRGVQATRCRILYFNHNNVRHLEELLKSVQAERNKDLRKFLIVEGLYINSGRISPLPQLIKICQKYKVRIFIDESISFGVLGKTGRGVLEHFQINNEDVDLIMASMEYALGTGGGFCAGSRYIVEHQRLSGLGYCFSASLPPFLAVAASAGLEIIDQQRKLVSLLSIRSTELHEALLSSDKLLQWFTVEGDYISPVKHLILKSLPNYHTYEQKYAILSQIVTHCRQNEILIVVANYLIHKEHKLPPASLRLTISITINPEEIMQLIQILEDVSSKVFSESFNSV